MPARRTLLFTAGTALIVLLAGGGVLVMAERSSAQGTSAESGSPTVPAPAASGSVTVPPLTTATTSVPTTSGPLTTSASAATSSSRASGTVRARSARPVGPSPMSSSSTSTPPSTSPTSGTSVRPTSTAAPVEPRSADTPDQVQEAVDRAVAQAADEGVTEQVVVADRSTGDVIAAAGGHDTVPSMSLVKLLIAADTIVEAGGVEGLDDDTVAQLHRMIATSDDGIAQDFYDQGGGDELIERTIQRYGLSDSTPTPEEQYWGDVQISARDIASLLVQALKSPETGLLLSDAMLASTDVGADGFPQDFGMNALVGAGAKQGWGCCLGGVLAIHSAGFTANRVVVVLSTSAPDADYHQLGSADELADDPGAQTAMKLVSATAAAVAA